ncbi:MAG: response regulator transcription factor [Actinomycetota bacterium]|jgi:two-component system, OmpR family, phosphate regulon response regulator PhoB
MSSPGAAPRTVLVVDDEPMLRNLLSRLLRMEGYEVIEAEDGEVALDKVAAESPDLVLLDVMLPARNGLDVLGDLRQTSDVPVILVSALGEEADRVLGLKLGADDYVVKPFSAAELSARIESVLRRARHRADPQAPTARMAFDGLVIDLGTREVTVTGERVEMTAKEFDLLAFLARSPRQVFSRDQLLHQVWGSSSDWQSDATVTEHVRRLRRKIEEDPDNPRWITTVRGVGYRFEP